MEKEKSNLVYKCWKCKKFPLAVENPEHCPDCGYPKVDYIEEEIFIQDDVIGEVSKIPCQRNTSAYIAYQKSGVSQYVVPIEEREFRIQEPKNVVYVRYYPDPYLN